MPYIERSIFIIYINSELCVVDIIFSTNDVRTIHTWFQKLRLELSICR